MSAPLDIVRVMEIVPPMLQAFALLVILALLTLTVSETASFSSSSFV
jgi:hypothetical protein